MSKRLSEKKTHQSEQLVPSCPLKLFAAVASILISLILCSYLKQKQKLWTLRQKNQLPLKTKIWRFSSTVRLVAHQQMTRVSCTLWQRLLLQWHQQPNKEKKNLFSIMFWRGYRCRPAGNVFIYNRRACWSTRHSRLNRSLLSDLSTSVPLHCTSWMFHGSAGDFGPTGPGFAAWQTEAYYF